MAIEPAEIAAEEVHQTVFVETFTNGVLGPEVPMLGPVADGGHIVWNSTPGCWGPMITPSIRGGHEVSQPVAVAGARVGDAIAIRIKHIEVTSLATASGNDQPMEGRFNGDPYCAPVCPGCGEEWPDTRVEGIGPEAIRCASCGADATPFTFTNGYTIAFDHLRTVGLTVPQEAAESFAREAARFAALPDRSVQHPILTFAPADIVALATRLRPFMGQIGTSPSTTIPDSHNAGDFGAFLVGAPHRYALTAQELQEHKTDGHMDVDAVRAGAILICPVKVDGGGVYLGDMHALQGDGEIAGHTCDVSGTVVLQVEVLKGLGIDGPVLFPLADDLPFLATPLSHEEHRRALAVGRRYGVEELEESLPISVIGTGPDLNSATDNGLARAGELLQLSVPEVKNRATIAGAIEIGRHPGVVQVTFRAPLERLDACGLLGYATEQYGEPWVPEPGEGELRTQPPGAGSSRRRHSTDAAGRAMQETASNSAAHLGWARRWPLAHVDSAAEQLPKRVREWSPLAKMLAMHFASPRRILIVANRTAATPALLAQVRSRAAQGRCRFTLLVPRPYWDPDTEEGSITLELAVPRLEEAAGGHVEGLIGDTDPFVAVCDALEHKSFDEVIVSTLPERVSHWLRRDLPSRVEQLGLPVTVVTAKGSRLSLTPVR